MKHVPVLLKEVIDHLQPEPNNFFLDGTVGQGGHAEALLDAALPVVRLQGKKDPELDRGVVRLLGIDRDSTNLKIAEKRLSRFGDAVVLVHDSYANAKTHAYAHGFNHFNAILLDLGFSSLHVDDPGRGFSFRGAGPLDMRYDQSQSLTAEEIINDWSQDELARIFRKFGEERLAARAANAIVEARMAERIVTTVQLADLIAKNIPRSGKIHPATRVFQALRIAVNDELGELERALPDFVDLLAPGGRIAIISFHSLEDRIVKRFFRDRDDLKPVNKRVITASKEEIKLNSRARSAKLRVAECI